MDFCFWALFVLPWGRKSAEQDPWRNISFHKLDNGLDVVLLPSKKSTNVQIEVRVFSGSLNESRANLGVAHLLEHLLFRSKRLGENQSYIELIQEQGGDANAGVSDELTRYYATLPSEKLEWGIKRLFDLTSKLEYPKSL